MSEKNEKNKNIYLIPPNFIESGTLFGGMFKVRNAIEAGILALVVGVPIFNLNLSLTTRVIIICLTSLPFALLALIGISGESLSSFILIFFKYLKNKRIIGTADGKTNNVSVNVKKNKINAGTYPK
jgi:hypothetical protein